MNEENKPYDKVDELVPATKASDIEIVSSSPLKRFIKRFLKKDVEDIESYIRKDIIKPRLEDLAYETGRNILSLLIYGGDTDDNTTSLVSSYNGTYTPYHNASKSKSGRPSEQRRVKSEDENVYGTVSLFDNTEIRYKTRPAAASMLNDLIQYINLYGQVSLAYYYSRIPGKTAPWTYNDYGWTDLRNVQIVACRKGGFIIDFPQPVNLRNIE